MFAFQDILTEKKSEYEPKNFFGILKDSMANLNAGHTAAQHIRPKKTQKGPNIRFTKI